MNDKKDRARLSVLGIVEVPISPKFGWVIIVVVAVTVVWWNWQKVCSHFDYCYPRCRDAANDIEAWSVVDSVSKDSGWVGGGSSPGIYCGAQLKTLQIANPERKIELAGSNENHKSEYVPFKRDYYRYTCEFKVSSPIYKLAASEHCLSQ